MSLSLKKRTQVVVELVEVVKTFVSASVQSNTKNTSVAPEPVLSLTKELYELEKHKDSSTLWYLRDLYNLSRKPTGECTQSVLFYWTEINTVGNCRSIQSTHPKKSSNYYESKVFKVTTSASVFVTEIT